MALLNRWTQIEDWNPNSHAQVKDYLRFKGYPIPKDRKDRTKETTGREELKKLHATLKKGGVEDPVLPLVMLSTALSKGVGYLSDKFVGKDERFHSDFTLVPKTNRLCIAEGTLIEVIRNVSKYPLGVPIEDVRQGDWAYTFDEDRKLCLRQVKWVGRTGIREVVRLHWRSGGRRDKSSFIDLTPEHKVRLTSGEYVEAGKLRPLDRVLALSRGISTWGYARLWATGHAEIPREHRFIFEQLYGSFPQHVHHIDGNKLNNLPENLEGLTASEHTSHHGSNISEETREKLRKDSRAKYPSRRRHLVREGSRNGRWLGLSKEWLLSELHEAEGRPLFVAKKHGLDYTTLKKYIRLHGIDWAAIKREHGRFAFGGRLINNHIIERVEILSISRPVYDLEVDETHNFIANEICVHNSAREPNLTNQPQGKGDASDPVTQVKVEVAEAVRATIIPSDGMKLGKCDWKAAEAILLGYFAEDSVYMRLSRLGVYSYFIAHDPELGIKIPDLNQDDASLRKELDSIKSAHRARYDKMKSTALGIGYGEKVPMISKQNGISWGEAKKYYDLFFRVAPKIRKFQNATKRRAQKEGYLTNPFGYTLDFWDAMKWDPEHLNKDGSSGAWVDGSEANESLAFLPQGTLGSMIKEVFLTLEPYEVEGEFHLLVPVHDETFFEASEGKFDFYAALVKRVMEQKWAQLGGLQLEAEVSMGEIWMECSKARHQETSCPYMHSWRENAS